MKCSQTNKNLSRYLDGKLGAAKVRELEEHLSRCARCSREHERLLSIRAALRGLDASVTVRPEFEISFFRALERQWRRIIKRPSLFERIGLFFEINPVWSGPVLARAAVPVLCLMLVVGGMFLTGSGADVRLEKLSGTAYYAKLSARDWASGRVPGPDSPLVRTDPLGNGTAIATDFGSTVELAIDEKVRVRVTEKSNVYLARLESGSYQIGVTEGCVYVQTTPAFAGSKMTVATPFSKTRIVGTAFLVQAWRGGSETRVLQGRVEVDSLAGGTVTLGAGEKVEVVEGKSPSQPSPMIAAEFSRSQLVANPKTSNINKKVTVDHRRESTTAREKDILPKIF